ncbi:M20/M25/M40 family metallo-hydrolase [Pilimelia columellifera]|uniref:M20/M25/M40 family metallo-hydrolase n=1 Tax=Pilimelia columellifera subsp. columellifera TaxID=706583 RepID=A0ABP6ARG5_9ACTN
MRRKAAWAAGAAIAVTGAVALTAPTVFAATGNAPTPNPQGLAPALMAANAADRLISAKPELFLKSEQDVMEQRSVVRGDDIQYVAYEKTHMGLPVVGGDSVVVTNSRGDVLDTRIAQTRALDVATVKARISAVAAIRTARGELRTVEGAGKPRLVVVADGAGKLAYEVVVDGVLANGDAARLHVHVDADTGKVLKDRSWNEIVHGTGNGGYYKNVTFGTTGSGGSFRMVDPQRPGAQCGGQDGQAFTNTSDNWGNGSGTDMKSACVDAMYAATKQWDMLKNWLGRDGVTGTGKVFPMRVGLQQVNAFYNGSFTNFGHSQDNKRQLTNIDVVAHEQGHGIFQNTPGGSGGGNEAGGLNESTGDIFGALTEFYANDPNDKPDYEVGEIANLVGKGPIRVMYEPSKVGDPNCMWTGSAPEVHAGAGPQNHWFYLLAEGTDPTNGQPKSPTCNNSKVTGIGIEKAGKIFMGTLNRKTSGWTHAKARAASVKTAAELFPNGRECSVVKAAWDGVKVPAAAGETACPAAGPDAGAELSLTLAPASAELKPGKSIDVKVSAAGSVTEEVTLSVSGLPANATATFNPTTVKGNQSSTMTLVTTDNTPTGAHPVTVTGKSRSGEKTVQFSLTVGAAGPGQTPGPTPTTPAPGPVTVPKIDTAKVKAHLQKFQQIADQNGGNRRSGRAGYTASVNYVVEKMKAAGYDVTTQACPSPDCTGGSNVIAEWKGGDANQVIMFGAHLDGVAAGPGINDNGSGSATILEVALALAEKNPAMAKRVRFGWWADEEQGLNGSRYYIKQLGANKSKIKGYLNFDMVASVNGGYFINNINTELGKSFKEYYDKAGIPTEENTEGRNRSDDASFTNAGISASGVAAGASATLTAAQAQKWGKKANAPRDPCYHAACDTIKNIDDTILGHSANAQVTALYKLAVSATSAPEPGPSNPHPNPQPGGRTFETVTASKIYDHLTTYSRISVNGVEGNANATVSVKIKAAHACAQDLRIELWSPEGRSYNLQSSRSTAGDCASFGSRTFEARGVTSRANGSWELRIRDDYRNDEGTLTGWTITL